MKPARWKTKNRGKLIVVGREGYENNAGRPFQQPVSQHALSSSLVVLTAQSQSQYYA